ncbi:MAG: hypothetical protein HY289_02560 [Planctomycetes bacterium]|nr:hypothetical protein [Planctomycetota bacterium]
MLDWLPGADPATRADGERLVRRALELFENYVTVPQRRRVTIAVCEIDGLEVAIVYHRNQKSADRIAGKLRKAGVAATGTSRHDHAEVVLFENEPAVNVIGISNIDGPCPACEKYFGNTPAGFANVYWDNDKWVYP